LNFSTVTKYNSSIQGNIDFVVSISSFGPTSYFCNGREGKGEKEWLYLHTEKEADKLWETGTRSSRKYQGH
jgi:hypothetical protein